MARNVELWMRFKNKYRRALSIPVDTCQRFSVYPLTWLCYVGYTIYGSEGHISTSLGGPEVNYYDEADIQPGKYYYVSQDPFLLDPDVMDGRTTDTCTSVISPSRANFRAKVTARDGNCVMVGNAGVEACHIIPHAKGNQYLINLVNHRSNGNEYELIEPPLDNIDDTRNGILLATHLHHPFGASEVAFLRTPNFAMTVNDVDLVMQPNADRLGFTVQPSAANTRLTFQHFDTDDNVTVAMTPHNSDARQSDSDEWPPPLLFDIAYGLAALKIWGVKAFKQFARDQTRDIYYAFGSDGSGDAGNAGGGGGDAGDAGGGGNQNGSDEQPGLRRSKRIHNQVHDNPGTVSRKKARNVARNTKLEGDQAVDVADMLMALWMQNAKECPSQAHATKADSTREKVQKWLESAEL